MSTTTDNPYQLDHDYDQEELFQSEPVEFGGDGPRDWEYPLTSFVPSALSEIGSRDIPTKAAYWIIPDVNNVQLVRMMKVFRTTFVNKVPPGFNSVFIRVNRQNQLNPTDFQDSLRASVLTKFPDKDGHASIAQTYYLPVINRYDDKWTASLAELSVKGYNAIKKEIASADDNSDGRITPRTRPIAIWKPAQREIEVRFDKKFDGSVKDLIEQYADDMIDPKAYIKLRSALTEKWFREQWRKFNDGNAPVIDDTDFTPSELFAQKVRDLDSPTMKRVLAEAGIKLNGARNKIALEELLLENAEKAEPIVAALTEDPPF
jgi:hypothetical protein